MKVKVKGLDPKLATHFTRFCCEHLPVWPKSIEIFAEDKLVNNKSGLCIDIDEDNYLILISKKNKNISQIYTSIAHEMVHVKQFMYDNLGELLDEGYNYDTCWWEQEARERSKKILLEFVKKFERKG